MSGTTTGPEAATALLLDLIEVGDVEQISPMLRDDVVWVLPMAMTGDPDDALLIEGRRAVLDRVGRLREVARTVRFVERRSSVMCDGETVFIQALGDFVTAAGRPYRNTYVFRFDWAGEQLVRWEEYANPVAVQQAYPAHREDNRE